VSSTPSPAYEGKTSASVGKFDEREIDRHTFADAGRYAQVPIVLAG